MIWQSHSTLKNEKLHNIVHSSNNQYTILYTVLHRSTIQLCETSAYVDFVTYNLWAY